MWKPNTNFKVCGCKLPFPVMSNLVSTADTLEIPLHFSSRTELSRAQKTVTSQNNVNTEWVSTHAIRKDICGSSPVFMQLRSLLPTETSILEVIRNLTWFGKDISCNWSTWTEHQMPSSMEFRCSEKLSGFPFSEPDTSVEISFRRAKPHEHGSGQC